MYMDKKIVAMIPARLDSKRIKYKNLRYLGDKLLIEHIIDTCKKVDYFDNIIINSPDRIFMDIASLNSIQYFERPKWNGKGVETNDDFTYEFLKKVDCDICILTNPTSPFITPKDIFDFIHFMITTDVDTLLTVENIKTQCLYFNEPINYNQKDKMIPTEKLNAVRMFVNGLMGWKRESFLKRYKKHGASQGYGSSVAYFCLNGYSTIDIDWEQDFELAEQIYKSIKENKTRYYEGLKC